MKQLTANLEGVPLSWALAVALGRNPECKHGRAWVSAAPSLPNSGVKAFDHTDPALCLGFIKEHVFSMECAGGVWRVFPHVGFAQCGQTLEQAVARCVCLMHLGEWVDMPIELCSMDVL